MLFFDDWMKNAGFSEVPGQLVEQMRMASHADRVVVDGRDEAIAIASGYVDVPIPFVAPHAEIEIDCFGRLAWLHQRLLLCAKHIGSGRTWRVRHCSRTAAPGQHRPLRGSRLRKTAAAA